MHLFVHFIELLIQKSQVLPIFQASNFNMSISFKVECKTNEEIELIKGITEEEIAREKVGGE